MASERSAIIPPTACSSHGADRLAVARDADDDGFEPLAQIFAIFGEREDRHDFARRGDDECCFAIGAVALAAHVDLDAAQRAIVHVHGARPGDLIGIEIEFVAVKQDAHRSARRANYSRTKSRGSRRGNED